MGPPPGLPHDLEDLLLDPGPAAEPPGEISELPLRRQPPFQDQVGRLFEPRVCRQLSDGVPAEDQGPVRFALGELRVRDRDPREPLRGADRPGFLGQLVPLRRRLAASRARLSASSYLR